MAGCPSGVRAVDVVWRVDEAQEMVSGEQRGGGNFSGGA